MIVRCVRKMIVSDLTKSFNGKTIIDNITLSLNQNEVIGLVGPNGSGKSTLLKIISGQIPADKGKVKLNNETAFYLNQEISPEFYNLSVVDYLKQITNLTNLEAIISNFEQHPDEANMEEYGNALEEYLKKDGYNFESNLSFILAGLNFDEPLDKKIKELSGGEKMKILLAAMLLSNDDIFQVVDLLRDEHDWSDSVSNLSNKLQRESLRYTEAVQLADALGYEIVW